MSYAYDPQIAPFITMIPRYDYTRIVEIRADQDKLAELLDEYVPAIPVQIVEHHLPRPDGAGELAVRVYRPETDKTAIPGMVYLHGGGFISGSAKFFDYECVRIASEVGAVVVSPDYRLAPENLYPAALDDCYQTLNWLHDQAAELGVHTGHIGIGGQSAGGGLTAAVTLLARDQDGPPICFQWLGQPELDDRLLTPSMDYEDTPMWFRSGAEYSWDAYLGVGRRGGDDVPIYAAPARAEDLTGLPPAFVGAAQFDPLRDESIDYGQRLAHANIPTEIHLYPGSFHTTSMVPQSTLAQRMDGDVIEALKRGLHSPYHAPED